MRGWVLALRLARRDARRARGRSLLAVAMIALPVLGVTAADMIFATSSIDGAEAIERRLGTADAKVTVAPFITAYFQGADPERGASGYASGGRRKQEPLTRTEVLDRLGGDRRALELREGSVRVETEVGVGSLEVLETDLSDPLTAGIAELTSGRWALGVDEVVVNDALAERAPGGRLVLRDGTALEVVGTAESAQASNYPIAFGLVGAFGLTDPTPTSWLVDGGPVTWEQVRDLNADGASVLSEAVLRDPPSTDELSPDMQYSTGIDESLLTVLVLIVVMVLMEVVLLAGPAFAVGARRLAHTLALVAAAGGTPRQARRVVLAQGVVLGTVAAVVGVALGLALAAALVPVVQRWSGDRFGPFDVAWLHVLGVAGFGLLSALLAAVVPAWLASRQDVVAVLAGRRGDVRASRRSPVLGLALLGLGVAGAAYGATRPGGGETAVAASAVVTVLGMILLVPVVVVAVAAASRRLPLPLRFATRDAARHRSRTVPAVAAVAATVAGVVALGIGLTSDEAENRGTYTPPLAAGAASISDFRPDADLEAYLAATRRIAPDSEPLLLDGLADSGRNYVELTFRAKGEPRRLLSGWGGALNASALVGDGEAALAMLPEGVDEEVRERAEATLAAGGVVAFANRADDPGAVEEMRVSAVGGRGKEGRPERVPAPATLVPVEQDYAPIQAILAPSLAERLGVEVGPVAVVVPDGLTAAQETDLSEAIGALSDTASVYVERGYVTDDEIVIAQLVLAGLGGLLMLGGTLTATFLALSDARPDLATLSAVGAAPRTRRAVAASYALVVGLVGAVLGAAVGFVPGIAVSYPLTRGYGTVETHYLDIPWLLIGAVVVGLPLLTSALVGLTARSRLPLTARAD